MSLALENNRINGLFRNIPIADRSIEAAMSMRVVERGVVVDDDLSPGPTSSSSSSSIGKNSDDDDDGDDEVESKLNNNNNNNNNNDNNNTENTSLDSAVDDLEQALPIRRGISKFYNGKSKSFASLSDAASTSIKDITKPENPYSRKRKNLLAYNLLNDKKSQRYPLPKYPGIPKRPISSSHSTLNFDIGSIDENESSPGTSWSNELRTPLDSPPASTQMPWRSFSLADLQQYGLSPSGNDARFLLAPLVEKRTKADEVFQQVQCI